MSTQPSGTILTGSDYLALPRQPETWLIRPLLPAGGAGIIYGDPKVGKSYAAIQLALALRHGGEWLGFQVPQGGPVAYIQLDTPRSLWATRLEELESFGHDVKSLYLADRETIGVWPFDILRPDHMLHLKNSLAPLAPHAVIVDTIRESHSGDENDSTTMRNVVANLVAATEPAALIVISHSRKPSPEGGYDLLADQRGSGYVVGRMDAICRMTRKTLHFTGRGIEEGSIRLSRLDEGFFQPEMSEISTHIDSVLSNDELRSIRSKAQELAHLTGKSEEACRSLLRREMSHDKAHSTTKSRA